VTQHLFFSSPFRDSRLWDILQTPDRVLVIVMESFASFIAYGIYRLTRYARQYEEATRDVLEAFKTRLASEAQADS